MRIIFMSWLFCNIFYMKFEFLFKHFVKAVGNSNLSLMISICACYVRSEAAVDIPPFTNFPSWSIISFCAALSRRISHFRWQWRWRFRRVHVLSGDTEEGCVTYKCAEIPAYSCCDMSALASLCACLLVSLVLCLFFRNNVFPVLYTVHFYWAEFIIHAAIVMFTMTRWVKRWFYNLIIAIISIMKFS